MEYLLLICAMFTNASGAIISSKFRDKNACFHDIVPFHNVIMTFTVTAGWCILWVFNGQVSSSVIPYSILYGIGYAGSIIGLTSAIKHGPVAITNLFLQFSLVATSIWGLIFWGEELSFTVTAGIVLVIASLICCLYKKRGTHDKTLTLKWFIFTVICFIGNGGAAITSRSLVRDLGGEYKYQLMAVGVGISFIISVFYYFFSDRRDTPRLFATSYLPLAQGGLNVLHNFIVLTLVSLLPSTLIYSSYAVGGLIIVTLYSCIFLREKLTPIKWVGIILGAAATLLLSL